MRGVACCTAFFSFLCGMNWDLLINSVFGIIGTLVGAVFTRRKQAAEAISVELANAKSVMAMWQETAESLRKEIAVMKVDMEDMHREIKALREENATLRDMLHRGE